jgi:hypothetical protein
MIENRCGGMVSEKLAGSINTELASLNSKLDGHLLILKCIID